MNRSTALLLILLGAAGACSSGGAPPATPSADEAQSATPAPASTGAPAAAPEGPVAGPSAPPSASPTTIVAITPGVMPSAVPVSPSGVEEGPPPPPSTTQKGLLHTQLAGTEVVFITVTDAGATCATNLKAASKGEKRIELRMPWKTGYYDFSNKMASARFDTYIGSFWQKADAGQGGIQLRAAPTAQGSTGRIHLKAKRQGGDSVDVELEVAVCTAVDLTPKKGKK